MSAASRFITYGAALLLAGSVASYLKSDNNQKPIAVNFMLISMSAMLTNEICIGFMEGEQASDKQPLINQINSLTQAKRELDKDYKKLSDKLDEHKTIIKSKIQEIETKDTALTLLKDEVLKIQADYNRKLQALDAKLNTEDSRYSERLGEFRQVLIEITSEKIHDVYNSLINSIDSKFLATAPDGTKPYEKLREPLEKFKVYIQSSYDYSCELLNEIGSLSHDELVVNGLKLYSQICTEITSIKVKYRNTLNVEERRELDNALEMLADYNKTRSVAKEVKTAYIEATNAHQQDLHKFKYRLDDSDNSLQEMREQVGDLVAQLEQEHIKVAQHNQKIEELSKPLQFYGSSDYAQAGNNISMFYYKNWKYRLDCINWTETPTGYEVTYAFRSNPGLTIEELYIKNAREQLAAFTNSHKGTLPEFEFNYQNCTVILKVTLRPPVKKETSKEDINKIWIPASKFESYVRRWERVRITAGSTGGKSPTAKNLALAIMNARQSKGEIRLYDPQHGSKKDYWDMPKAGTSHEDSVSGMSELCDELDRRTKRPGDHPFLLFIFDEVDSTIAQEQEKKDYYFFRNKVTYSLKQASHQNIGCIYIGQASDASTIPGMTWSDWNNAIQLHIGANAGLWLDKCKTITGEDKTKLLEQYAKIQGYCDRMNEELGLDIFTDATAYRFALAVPLTGLPKFIQLPDFDTYDYYKVISTNTQDDLFSDSMPINNNWQEIKIQEPKIACPHCNSTNFKKNGKDKATKSIQQYLCNDCGKTFSEKDILANNN